MFSSFSFSIPQFSLRSDTRDAIKLPSVEIHDVEESAEKRARTLKHLVRANHVNHSIIYHSLQKHNQVPHVLGSAYLLGATSEHLTKIYENEVEKLEPWHDAPGEISKEDWREFIGKREYQRAFIDFFEDQLVLYKYDWKRLLHDYLFEGPEPLVNNLFAGLGHPLIHLAYAYELSSHTIGMEALALSTCFQDTLHKYVDEPSYTRPSSFTSTSVLELLNRIAEDRTLDKLFDQPGVNNVDTLLGSHEDIILDYWNAWDLDQPVKQFEESQKAAVALLVATHEAGKKHDFFLEHLLTTSHAVRVLLPLIPPKFHLSLVRQWWLFTIIIYLSQLRPAIRVEEIQGYDVQGRDWKYVVHQAFESAHSLDSHYVKALRAIKEAASTWGDEDLFYLKAALKFADEFEGWGGFGASQ